jgi:hypothetical protein
MLTCGLLRSNFSLAIARKPHAKGLERGTGFEPATIALEERDSTIELPPPELPTPPISGAWDRD